MHALVQKRSSSESESSLSQIQPSFISSQESLCAEGILQNVAGSFQPQSMIVKQAGNSINIRTPLTLTIF